MTHGSALSSVQPAWTTAFILLGVLTLVLLMISVLVNVVWATVALPTGIGFGWVAGRVYEARAVMQGSGVRR